MIKLLTICTQTLTALSMILVYLADQWMSEGFGINPYIALPLSTLLIVLPYLIDHFFIEVVPEQGGLSCIQLNKPPTSP